jgi:hypothetical protein
MSCLFFGLSGTSAEGGGFERTFIPCGGIDNMMLTVPSDMRSERLKRRSKRGVNRDEVTTNLEAKCR